MRPTLHIHLLGDFLLLSGETPVTTVMVPRVQSLLTYLVLHRSAPQDRSHLAFLLWPDSTEAQAHTNLRKLLYHLRQAFPDADRFLQSNKHQLQWLPTSADDTFTLDVMEFEEAIAQATQAEAEQDPAAIRSALEHAVNLYHGELLPSCYEEWIVPERERLHQMYLQAAERLLTLLEQERAYPAAITVAQQLLRHDTLHEATYQQLMRLYALHGDRVAALRVYHTCVTTLERELGTEPSEATQAVYEALMHSTPISQPSPHSHPPRETTPSLLGRTQEWQQLQDAWRKAIAGHTRVVILTGEAGIGKTRLAEEMEAWVSRQGMTTICARCYATLGHLAYAPITTWLRSDALSSGLSTLAPIWLTEIARLMPEVLLTHPDVPRPAAMIDGWQRQHFFEALARTLHLARQPLLLLLEDLQWCDSETLEWLEYFLHAKSKGRILLIGTVRTEEAPAGHPLIRLLSTLQRDDLAREIALGPLTIQETTTLAEQIMGQPLNSALSDTLYAETEGNPLFVVEMARAGSLGAQATSSLSAKGPQPLLTQPASTLPPVIQTVLTTRLAQLSREAHEVANVAAVIGREFAFDVLAHACREPEEVVVRGLDELWQRRIVQEQGEGTADTYDFSHEKLRELVYVSLSPTYQRLLHRRVAEAFEAVYADNLDAVSGQIAAHYERAGLPDRAIPAYRRAGETALRVYANADAIMAFRRAIALLEDGKQRPAQRAQQWKETVAIYASLGDILATTGRHQEARQVYQDAMKYVLPGESFSIETNRPSNAHDLRISQSDQRYIWQARLLRKMASTWNRASGNPLDTFHSDAQPTFQAAERILEQATDKSRIEWLREWIDLQLDQLLPLRGSLDEMTVIINKAQSTVEQYGTVEQRGQFFQAVVARDAIRDRYVATEETIAYCRKALTDLLSTGNQSLIGFAHFVLGNRLLWANQLDEAEKEMCTAVQIAEQIGNTTLLTRCLTFLPFIYRRRGQVERVRSILTRAQDMGATQHNSLLTGHRAWIAWHDGNLTEVERHGRASLEERQPQRMGVNPFQWVGLWPLIAVTLAQEKIADAINDVRMLLAPTQQRPPEQLSVLLRASLQAWDAGRQDEAHTLLQQAVSLAEKTGYL